MATLNQRYKEILQSYEGHPVMVVEKVGLTLRLGVKESGKDTRIIKADDEFVEIETFSKYSKKSVRLILPYSGLSIEEPLQ